MNITLIGMPGAGKSTVGVILSKYMNLNFTDTDLIIQLKYGEKLSKLIKEHGTDGFIDLEMNTIISQKFEKTVIATGGSVVYKEETMDYLKSISTVVFIDIPLSELKKRVKDLEARGVVSKNAKNISEIFEERRALYIKYADKTITTTGLTAEESAIKISELFNS